MNNKLKRIVAAIIDYTVILFIAVYSIVILTLGNPNESFVSIIVFFVLFILLMLFKDCAFGNKSIGKRILKLKIVKTNNTKLTVFDIMKRNSTILLMLPIEVLMAGVEEKRVGDIWAKTLVVYDDYDINKTQNSATTKDE